MTEEKLLKDDFLIPKNTRQIGQVQDEYRIYMEDYVTTYLNQIAAGVSDKSKMILLLGFSGVKDESTYYFIRGAVAAEKEYEVTKNSFQYTYEKDFFEKTREEYFPNMDIIGWGVIKGELGRISQEYITGILNDSEWNQCLFMEIDKYNCIDRFYICGAPFRRACSGYFVFYDRNDEMQNYLIYWNELRGNNKRETDIVTDRTSGYYRETLANKQKSRKPATSGGSLLVMAAVIMLLVMAISSFNNFEKLSGLEAKIEDVGTFLEKKLQIAAATIHSDDSGEASELISEGDSNPITEIPEDTGEPIASNPPILSEGSEVSEVTETDPPITEPIVDEPITDEPVITDPVITDPVTTEPIIEEPDSLPVDVNPVYDVYVVKVGDTLLSICREHYGDIGMVDAICELNNIQNGDLIFYGQKILLP